MTRRDRLAGIALGLALGVGAAFCLAAVDDAVVVDTVNEDQPIVDLPDLPAPEPAELTPTITPAEPVETVEPAPAEPAPVEPAPVPTAAPTAPPVSTDPSLDFAKQDWDLDTLECGVNAKPAVDQDGYGNWWAYCEPALVGEE